MKWRIRIENFKCFAALKLELAPLCVLCGRNGAGKSSFIQAILLQRQATSRLQAGKGEIPLNGPPGLALGTVSDIVHRGSTSLARASNIILGFGREGTYSEATFDTEGIPETANAIGVVSTGRQRPKGNPWDFVYLSAERAGPRISQERLSNLPASELSLGEHGENTAEVLQRFERSRIRPQLILGASPGDSTGKQNTLLNKNLERWLSSMFGATQILVDGAGIYTPPAILIRTADSDEWVRSTNFGFGVTYSLPILLAGLLVREGGVLVVDGPEAHLHPAAQTAMARFLACVAASGCSVIVETHSDHLVDGLRLAAVDSACSLRPSDLTFLNFDRLPDGSVEVKPIELKDDGSLSEWPRGFFDQQSINLRQLAASRRK
jgi:predicted ATPase